MINIICKKLVSEAILPVHSTEMAAGYDLFTYEDVSLQPGEYRLYRTGITMAIPDGIYGRIAPRSGLAFKNGIDVLAGVIDADYRNEIGIILINHGNQPWNPPKDNDGKLKPIAQMIFENYNYVNFEENMELPKPESTRRGGFGSTDNVIKIKDPMLKGETLTVVGGVSKKEETKKTYETKTDLVEQWRKIGGPLGNPIPYEQLIREREKKLNENRT